MNLIRPISNTAMLASRFAWQLSLLIVFLIDASINSTFASEQQHRSKRIEVYALSQNYWDTQYGDTLSKITYQLLPNNPAKRKTLTQDILQLNPNAFSNGDPARLLAGKRLWLPGYAKQPDSMVDPAKTTVEIYSWGNIKRPKNK